MTYILLLILGIIIFLLGVFVGYVVGVVRERSINR